MTANVVGLTLFQKKGAEGIAVSELTLLQGIGIDGDYHQGTDRQVSLLTAEVRSWIDVQPLRGLCFARFKENILTEGIALEELADGSLLVVGDAVLRLQKAIKYCYDECAYVVNQTPCRLSGFAVYAAVKKGGTVRIGDTIVAAEHLLP